MRGCAGSRLLHGSLIALIQEKGLEALSVQNIIDRANVGRATFYAHFDSKEDLLASGIENLSESLRERQPESRSSGGSDERLFAFSRELFAMRTSTEPFFVPWSGNEAVRSCSNCCRAIPRVNAGKSKWLCVRTVSQNH